VNRADLEPIRDAALAIAREAGELVRKGYRKQPTIEHKGAMDLVTEFDRASEAFLRARLAAAARHPIIGEEEGGTWDPSVPTFFIDPLDGTTNFVHGHPNWSVSVGLVEQGQAVLGIVVAPMLGLAWWGLVPSDGVPTAMREGEPCRVSRTARLEDALVATGFPYDRLSPEDNFAEFMAIQRKCQGVRRCGSAAIDLCSVADGTYDGYWEQKLGPWDLAGGAAVVRAAGGTVTDFDGQETFLATGRVVASNGVLHPVMRAELDAVRRARTLRGPSG
jgi:myo-inositol-1(or 4)-monophosphatase